MNVLLFDGTGLAYRSYYAFVRNPLRNSRGEETSLTFAFVNTLLKLVQRHAPERAAVVFDAPGRNFRHGLDAHYKEGRPPMPESMAQQLPRLHEMLAALALPVLQVPGFEADDVLGTLARHFEARGDRVYLVTADKDLQQLLSDRVHLLRFRRTPGEMEEIGPAELRAELGLAPDQVVDYLALVGDSVDNVPGIPGIGPKTARGLIGAHGSLERLFANLEQVDSPALRRKLEAGHETALRARELVALASVPLDLGSDALDWKGPDWPRVRGLVRELEFFQLLRQLPAERATAAAAAVVEPVADAEELEKLGRRFRDANAVALHAVVAPDATGREGLVALAIAGGPERIEVVRVAPQAAQLGLGELGLVPAASGGLDLERVRGVLVDLLAAPRLCKIGHDLKQLVWWLDPWRVRLEGPLFDTLIASYVLNPGRRSHPLDALAAEFLDVKWGAPPAEAHRISAAERAHQAGEECAAVWRLSERFRPLLEAERLQLLFDEVEMPLLNVLLDMERAGVQVDVKQLRALSHEFETKADALAERIYVLAGRKFNLQSTRQLGEILFQEQKLPHGRRTQTGWSTDVDVLERLAAENELPRLVLEYRQLAKLRSTYTEALPKLLSARTGRIHTRFNQAVAATGRLSSSDPNLQNIPTRTELGRRIRAAFVPEREDARLVSADYSQIELRILAHLSQDRGLVQAFRDGGDVHTLTAARIAGCAPADVTPEQRSAAKTVNFGVIYGMGPRGLAQQLGIAVDAARSFIDEYFATYPGVRVYGEEAVARARAQGFATTLLGRRLALPDLQSSHPGQRAFAERVAVNAPIQGSAADLIKTAMVRVRRRLGECELGARMILQVHDELLFECPVDEVETLGPLVRAEMENAVRLTVPIVVEIGVGRNWAEAH
jgi:DNA polymerase-1